MLQSLSMLSGAQILEYSFRKSVATLLFAGAIVSLSVVSAAPSNLQAIVLSIHGNIEGEKTDTIELDLATLTELEATTFTTIQPWTEEPNEYTGVRVNTLLEHVGAMSSEFQALASDRYQFILSNIDFEKYPIIIAYKVNGEFLDTRKLGPLLIVFPFDDYPELLNETNKASSVWQLTEMHIL